MRKRIEAGDRAVEASDAAHIPRGSVELRPEVTNSSITTAQSDAESASDDGDPESDLLDNWIDWLIPRIALAMAVVVAGFAIFTKALADGG